MSRISARAVVETETIGTDVTIAEFAVVRPDVTIGNRVVIHPHGARCVPSMPLRLQKYAIQPS